MRTFDEMAEAFTIAAENAACWRTHYPGAAYSTRIRAAIDELRAAIAAAELHPEISKKKEGT